MIIELLNAELKRDEGVRYTPYKDTRGFLTVGVGHNLDANPLPEENYPLTEARVDEILDIDLKKVFSALDAHLPWWSTLDEVRQRVLANMTFNMGMGTLLTFKNTLQCVSDGKYNLAAAGMMSSAWFKQVGQRAVRLCQAMNTGVMPD